MNETFQELKCHECDELLTRKGVSSFGWCQSCNRQMLFREWKKLAESEFDYNSDKEEREGGV